MLLDKDLTPIHFMKKHYHVYDEILDSLDMLLDTGLITNPYAEATLKLYWNMLLMKGKITC